MDRFTTGQVRVRHTFNPSDNRVVDQIKKKTAELIDICEALRHGDNNDVARCATIAEQVYEEAAMWAVKAATG